MLGIEVVDQPTGHPAQELPGLPWMSLDTLLDVLKLDTTGPTNAICLDVADTGRLARLVPPASRWHNVRLWLCDQTSSMIMPSPPRTASADCRWHG
jgi:hypothetical protein